MKFIFRKQNAFGPSPSINRSNKRRVARQKSVRVLAAGNQSPLAGGELRSHQFSSSQRGLEHAEQALFLRCDRLLGVESLFQRQPGLRLSQTENPLALDELDQINLDFAAIKHSSILP